MTDPEPCGVCGPDPKVAHTCKRCIAIETREERRVEEATYS